MFKVKSIDELYEEISQDSLVITNDAPLSTALNKRLDKPLLGDFCVTPKVLGSKFSSLLFRNEVKKIEEIILIVKKSIK